MTTFCTGITAQFPRFIASRINGNPLVLVPVPAAEVPAVKSVLEVAEPAREPVRQPEPAMTEPVEAAAPAEDKAHNGYRDGTYYGWGYSRHGDIQAYVTIENGRIAAAGIEKCWTRYSCSWIQHLPAQVVSRQSPEVDYVSGATQSVNAFYGGIVEALAKAK